MKLLYIIPSFQHPNVRGPNRHYHLVRELSSRHDITLLVLNRSVIGREAYEEVRSYVDELHVINVDEDNGSNVTQRIPFVGRRLERVVRFRSALQRMQSRFRQLISQHKFDLVVFHGKSVFPVIENCNSLPIVVDFCDATSMRIRHELQYVNLSRRMWLWLRYADIRRIEKEILRKTPHVAFIARRDRDAILGPDGHAEILPNGVDHEFWHRSTPQSNRPSIVFSGVMSYSPNNDAALLLLDRIGPRIRQAIPDVEILIVGRDPSPELKARTTADSNVTVTGFVDDVRPYLERAAVFAAPLRYASGTQNKVLEAMSMAIPAVVTPVVADGLRMDRAGEPPVCVAESEADFAAAIVRLLKYPSERSLLAEQGREYVESHFIWSRSAQTLERMCLTATGTSGPQKIRLIGATS